MSRITPVDDSATDEQKALLDAVKSLLGATPNMTTTMARSAVLEGWLNLNGALRKGSIGTADAERVALGVAEANGCSYCLSAHTYLGANVARIDDIEAAREAGLTDEELGDIVGHVAVNVLTNYFNKAFDVEVDFPVVEPHVHAAAA
jgi:AhpD family alkylhydroperoxidase